ncbi:MAG TPA: hypothetical protein VFH51_06075, partial [Myxococcota bacterium]|nr:hypothetical protein [Myxococcota bacterium]
MPESHVSSRPEVVIVSPSPEALRELCQRAETAGYTARGFADAPTALAALQAWPPRLLVTEIGMPDMNGVELCAALRKRFSPQDLQLLCLGPPAAGLGRLLRARYGAGFVPADHAARLLPPILRLLARVDAHPVHGAGELPRFRVQFRTLSAWLQELETNIRAGGLCVEAAETPEPETVVALDLHLPYVEFVLRLQATAVRTAAGAGTHGFPVALHDFSRDDRLAFAEFLEALRPLQNPDLDIYSEWARPEPDASPTQWFVVVDPKQALLDTELSILQRPGLSVATFKDVALAEQFVRQNGAIWVGVSDAALPAQGPSLDLSPLQGLRRHSGEVIVVQGEGRPPPAAAAETEAPRICRARDVIPRLAALLRL